MKKYPHHPKERNQQINYQGDLRHLERQLVHIDAAVSARDAHFLFQLAQKQTALAAFAYAFDEPDKTVLTRLRDASSSLLQSLAFGLVLNPFYFENFLGVALIARNRKLITVLAKLDRHRLDDPGVECPEIMYDVARIMADLASAARSPGKIIATAEAALSSDKLDPLARESQETLVQLARAIHEKDVHQLDDAVAHRHKDFAKRFSRPHEREFPEGLLDVAGLGLLQLASDHKMKSSVSSVYLPTSLLR